MTIVCIFSPVSVAAAYETGALDCRAGGEEGRPGVEELQPLQRPTPGRAP